MPYYSLWFVLMIEIDVQSKSVWQAGQKSSSVNLKKIGTWKPRRHPQESVGHMKEPMLLTFGVIPINRVVRISGRIGVSINSGGQSGLQTSS